MSKRLARGLLAAILCGLSLVTWAAAGKTEVLWLGQSATRITSP